MEKNNIVYKIFNKFINILAFLLLVLALVNIFIIKDNIELNFNYNFIFISMLIYVLAIFLVMKYYYKKENHISKIKNRILLCVCFSIQVIYAVLIRRKIGFDCEVLGNSALDLSNGIFTNVEYFSMYSNNIFLLLSYEILFRIVTLLGGKYYIVSQIIMNVIITDIAIFYIYKTCKIMFGEKYSNICNIISIPMLAITPYIAVPYSDMVSLIFPIGIFYNYLCIRILNGYGVPVKRRIIILISLIIIGYLIKPTNIIMAIAIIIFEFIKYITNIASCNKFLKNNYKKVLYYCAYAIGTIIIVYGGFNIYKNVRLGNFLTKEEIENNKFPMTHFVMMGLRPVGYEGKYYGCYNEDDVNATKAQIGVDAKIEYNINEISNRIKNMKFSGVFSHLYDKYTWIISDGTFFYGREGNFYKEEATPNNVLEEFVQYYAYFDKEGHVKVTINIMQTVWIVTLIFVVVDICSSFFCEKSTYINILKLSFIGIIFFIVMFEARARYLINYLPIIIVIATSGIINLYKFIKKEKSEWIEDK